MDIDGARSLLLKAVKKVDDLSERLNLLKTMLNVEFMFGDVETRAKMLDFAQKNTAKRKDVFLHWAELLANDELLAKGEKKEKESADDYFKKLLKKYNGSKKCFVAYNEFLIKRKKWGDCEKLITRVLSQEGNRKKDQTALKMCISFYKKGEYNEGNKFFERLLQNFPKRKDFWLVFIQMETNAERYPVARMIFNRLLQTKLSSFRRKGILKQFYDFEEKHGTQDDIKKVEELAKQ